MLNEHHGKPWYAGPQYRRRDPRGWCAERKMSAGQLFNQCHL